MNIKFYIGKKEQKEPKNVFLVIWDSTDDGSCNPNMVMSYCPIGQHGEASIDYVKNDCKEITKDDYLHISEGLYTPPEYLL